MSRKLASPRDINYSPIAENVMAYLRSGMIFDAIQAKRQNMSHNA